MMKCQIAVLLCILATAFAWSNVDLEQVTVESFENKEQWFAQAGWNIAGPANPQATLDMHIFVKQQNTEELETMFWDVSNPTSANYGKYLSFEELNNMVRPTAEHLLKIVSWLRESGVDMTQVSSNPANDIIAINAVPVVLAEKLLNTKYYTFRHASSGTETIRTNAYSLPRYVAEAVDFVGPTVRLPTVKDPKFSAVRPNAPMDAVTPDFLRKLYNVGGYQATNSNSSVGVTGFLDQYISMTDLQSFFTQYDPQSQGRKPIVIGPNNEGEPGVEASLDIQYVMAMATGVPKAYFWSTAGQQPGNPGNEPFLVWLNNVASASDVPLVFSISYGDNENTVSFDYAVRVNTELQKMGVRGLSIMSSSGDGGVGGGQPSLCSTFIPTYPAASPYITAVGGTASSNPEVAGELSSGGFSNYWARPDYQKSFVDHYKQTASGIPDSKLFNQTGAGFPDVAAQAYNFMVYTGGFDQPVAGTSCSSPTFAGMVALLNDVRLNANKPPLGYLNQLFYQHPDAFNDILSGSNPGCFTNGFPAAAGWDPVTGLGSMDFGKWKAVVESLP